MTAAELREGQPEMRIPTVSPDEHGEISADIVIIGSGMGGSTVAHALAGSGADILVVERGDFLPREYDNWSAEAVFGAGRYKNAEKWHDARGEAFTPGVHYFVGGNTKVFGAMMPRFRESDFGPVEHPDGISPPWPITYTELEPYYTAAEKLYQVHGQAGADPTDPWRSGDFPYPAVEHDEPVAELAAALQRQGLHPYSMPAAVGRRSGGGCVLCPTCDGFPCMIDAKGDAEVMALRPVVADGAVRLLTRTQVLTLRSGSTGRTVTTALAVRDGRPVRIGAGRFVLACGAVNTAAVLLRSSSSTHPGGLANTSGRVGRNYMVHNSTFLVGIDPRRENTTRFQKTLAFNDWYEAGGDLRYPLGNVQMLGKLRAPMIAAARPHLPRALLSWATGHSVDLYLTSEDLPNPENRVIVDANDRIVVHWRANNLSSHRSLVRKTRRAIRAAGYPLTFTQRMRIETNSHQCGTAVMGTDPASSVVDPCCKAHDLDNLWIVDSAPFPSSAAINPALTIAANALRVAAIGGITT